jgi:hypothetical protein
LWRRAYWGVERIAAVGAVVARLPSQRERSLEAMA